MTEQQLQLFDDLSYYEGVDVEYEGARGGLPRDLWETYSAFANTDGGTLWLARTWYTTKPCHPTRKCQVSHVVVDSTWEDYTANVLEKSGQLAVYVKNNHLGFQVHYLWNGARRCFVPDFIIRLSNGRTLVLEIKGEDSEQNRAKRDALDLWVKAVNAKGGFGVWCWDVAFQPAQVHDILTKAVSE